MALIIEKDEGVAPDHQLEATKSSSSIVAAVTQVPPDGEYTPLPLWRRVALTIRQVSPLLWVLQSRS